MLGRKKTEKMKRKKGTDCALALSEVNSRSFFSVYNTSTYLIDEEVQVLVQNLFLLHCANRNHEKLSATLSKESRWALTVHFDLLLVLRQRLNLRPELAHFLGNLACILPNLGFLLSAKIQK
jgi:hypothetical protein